MSDAPSNDTRPTPKLGDLWRDRKRELLTLWLMGLLVLCSYGVARPATDSLFLSHYGKESLPWVWLGVAVAALATTAIYNRLAGRLPLSSLFTLSIAASGASLVALLLLQRTHAPWVSFLLYVWRDLYIVVLVEVFWSYANCVFDTKTARLVYGSFLVAGTAGEFTGTQLVGFLARRASTEQSLWAVVLLFLGAYGASFILRRYARAVPAPKGDTNVTLASTAQLLRTSPYLLLLVLLVVLVQIAITLIDYEYNGMMSAAFPNTNERTAKIGDVYGAIALGALLLQLASSPLLRFAGVVRTLTIPPLFLGMGLMAFLLVPSLWVMLVTKVMSKAFDYSLMRAGKEMLYIPLSYAEKTQGKAVVDILTYRVAKGATSLLLLGLIALGAGTWVLGIALGLVLVWLVLVFVVGRRYRALTSS